MIRSFRDSLTIMFLFDCAISNNLWVCNNVIVCNLAIPSPHPHVAGSSTREKSKLTILYTVALEGKYPFAPGRNFEYNFEYMPKYILT